MIINWEDIRWEVDDAGTSWASVADEEHNSLTLENRGGKITFHTDGSPRFDARRVLEITALCMILEQDVLAEPAEARQGHSAARGAGSRDADTFIPGQRHAPDPEPAGIQPEAIRLAQAGESGRSQRRHASRRALPVFRQPTGVRRGRTTHIRRLAAVRLHRIPRARAAGKFAAVGRAPSAPRQPASRGGQGPDDHGHRRPSH